MTARKYTAPNSNYRYGFNGKENDNEVKGEGNQQDYGMRIYDPRIGRFLSVDPLFKDFSAWSCYTYTLNNPVSFVDRDGRKALHVTLFFNEKTKKYSLLEVKRDNQLWREDDGGNIFTGGFNWFDYVEVTILENHSQVPNMKQVKNHQFFRGKKRTWTWGTTEDNANRKIGEFNFGGFTLTSESPSNSDHTNGEGSPEATVNVDGIVAAVSGMAKLSLHGLEFEGLGKVNEFLEKFNEALNSASEATKEKFMKTGSFDMQDPASKELYEKMQNILNQYGAKQENSTQTESTGTGGTGGANSNAKPAPVVRTNGGKNAKASDTTKGYSRKSPVDPKNPDTLIVH